MFQTTLSSFLALFVPGLICLAPVVFAFLRLDLEAGKYLSLLLLPFAYVAGWVIYEYGYYTRRDKMHQLRMNSWEKHFAKLKQRGRLMKSVQEHKDISTRIHLAFFLILHRGGGLLTRRVEYYLNSLRILICVPTAVAAGLIISVCLTLGSALSGANSDYLGLVGLCVFYAVFLLFLVLINVSLSRARPLAVPFRLVERVLYYAAWERQDQWVASLVRALAAIDLASACPPVQSEKQEKKQPGEEELGRDCPSCMGPL